VKKKIGILDIFGFEIFKLNSLEQLCINYCNERLQNLFNRTVFMKEERIYKEENIGVANVPYIDNQPILDLIEKTRPMGLLASLDEELKKPGGNIRKYKSGIDSSFSSNKYYRRGRSDMHFVLTHYAGDVSYTVEEFMEKNKDSLTKDLADLAGSCKIPLMKSLFGKSKNMSSRKRKATLCKQFRTQLDSLMKTLDQTQPHYIRCIKPNDTKEALYFVSKNCLEQLTYSGVFEAVKIRKTGFPFRLRHQEFVDRYKCILEEDGKRCGSGQRGCKDIVNHLKLNMDNIRTGKTMMLYRAEEHSILELKQSIIQEQRKMAETLREILKTNVNNLPDPEVFYQRVGQVVRSCNRYNIHTKDAEDVREMLEVFIMERMDPQTRDLLEQALQTRDLQSLIDVCEIIELNDYQTTKCQLAVKLRDRILRVYEESRAAAETLEVEHMRAVMAAANEVGYHTDEIDDFRNLFSKCTPPGNENCDAFMKQHLKMCQANVKRGVEGAYARTIAIEIKIKDKMFSSNLYSQQFEFTNFPGLKDADDWAGESWNMFKGNLKDTMMVWTKEKIHTSITKLDKTLKKQCVDNLTNIQYFCSDRPVANGNAEEYGLKVLLLGYNNEAVRDEIYCQIIKQIRQNEQIYSIGQCWKLMNLCLFTFRPSVKIENYLIMFIRNNAGQMRDSVLKNLETTLYNRDSLLPNPPTLNDMRDIAQGARMRFNFLEEPPQAPSWLDLLQPFDENTPYDYNAPLPGKNSTIPKSSSLVPKNSSRQRLASMQTPPKPPTFNPAVQKQASPKANKSLTPPKFDPSQRNRGLSAKKKKKEPEKFVPPVPPQFQKKQPEPEPETYVWIAHLDVDSGDLYYCHAETEETQWDRPRELIKPFFVAKPDDSTGQFYYEDLVNGETTWEAPEEYCDEKEQWVAHLDEASGDYYFENFETQEVTWDRPESLLPKSQEEWVRHFDTSSQNYYYENLQTGHVQWDEPAGFSA